MAQNEWLIIRGLDGPETGRVEDSRVGNPDGSSLQFGIGATGGVEDLMLFRRVDARTKTGRITVYVKRLFAPFPIIDASIAQEDLLVFGSIFSLRSFSKVSGAGMAFDLSGIFWFTFPDAIPNALYARILPVGLPAGPNIQQIAVAGELEHDANGFAGIRLAVGEHYSSYIRMRGEALIAGVWRPFFDAPLAFLFSDPNLGDMFGISQQSMGDTLGSSVHLDSALVEAGDFLPDLTLPRTYTFDNDSWETELIYPDVMAALFFPFGVSFQTVLPVRIAGTQPTAAGTHLLRLTRYGDGQQSVTRSIIFPDAGAANAGRKVAYWFRYVGGTEVSIISEFRPDNPYTHPSLKEQLKLDFVTSAPGLSGLYADGFGLLETNVAPEEFFYVEFSVQDEVIDPAPTLVDIVDGGNTTAIHITDVSEVTMDMIVEFGSGFSKERSGITIIDGLNSVLSLDTPIRGTYDIGTEVRIGRTRRVAKYRRGMGTLTTIQDGASVTAGQPCFGKRVVVRLDRDLSSTLEPVPTDVDYDDLAISDMPELAL